jgi:hypothetical protein
MNSPKRPGRPESPQSNATFPKRSEKPGEAGLANEARPGLGTRQDEGANQDDGLQPLKRGPAQPSPQDHEPLGRNAPLPKREPREQKNDPAREAERDTGVTGHTGAD